MPSSSGMQARISNSLVVLVHHILASIASSCLMTPASSCSAHLSTSLVFSAHQLVAAKPSRCFVGTSAWLSYLPTCDPFPHLTSLDHLSHNFRHPTTATASSASPQSSPPDCACRILFFARRLVVPLFPPEHVLASHAQTRRRTTGRRT